MNISSICRGSIAFVKSFLRAKKYLLIVAICVSSWAFNGCVDSVNYLASDSRLPGWFTLPPGLTRADVTVVRESMEPHRRDLVVDIKVYFYDRKYKKLAAARGKTIRLGSFVLNVVNGVPEITGYRAQKDEHGNLWPYFYVVDEPALKTKLLNENEKKLIDYGFDFPSIRKRLLDENSGPIPDHPTPVHPS